MLIHGYGLCSHPLSFKVKAEVIKHILYFIIYDRNGLEFLKGKVEHPLSLECKAEELVCLIAFFLSHLLLSFNSKVSP